jgi:hypothetical protein
MAVLLLIAVPAGLPPRPRPDRLAARREHGRQLYADL